MNALLHPITLGIIGIFSVARMARFVTYDDFPPMSALRLKIAGRLGKWANLMVCPFCIVPYLMAVQIAWFLLLYENASTTTLLWFWVLPNAWWGASYVASIIVAYDQPED